MRVLDLRKYRILIILIAISVIFGVFIYTCKNILKIVYPFNYGDIIKKYSSQYDLDPLLVASVIRAESKFDKNAVSPKGAKGLMQISSITGKWAGEELDISGYKEEILFNPDINIKIGCWYLNKLKKEFNNNMKNVLASYNAGSGNVTKWLGNKKYSNDGNELIEIPFGETREYIKRVNRNFKVYKYLYE